MREFGPEPYCDEPGCHDSRTAFYGVAYVGQYAYGAPSYRILMNYHEFQGAQERLCRIHALKRYRTALG